MMSIEMGDDAGVGSSPLWWANCYKVGQFVFALVEMDLWRHLCEAPVSAAELAADSGLDATRLASALDLLYRFGLLMRSEDGQGEPLYRLAAGSRAMEPLLRLEAHLQRQMITSDRVGSWLGGAPCHDPLDQQPSEETVGLFLNGFEAFGEKVALHIWRLAKLGECSSLLDLGGAAGGHAAVFSRLSKRLTFTIVDRQTMRQCFELRRREMGLEDRMVFEVGNLCRPESFVHRVAAHDAILMSNVLHLMSPNERDATCRAILEVMRPGARLVIHDLFLGTDDWQMSAFMSVDWMLLGADFSMTVEECGQWLQGFGFRITACRALPGLPSGLVVAERAEDRA